MANLYALNRCMAAPGVKLPDLSLESFKLIVTRCACRAESIPKSTSMGTFVAYAGY